MFAITEDDQLRYFGARDEMKLAIHFIHFSTDLGVIDFESGDGRNYEDLNRQYQPDRITGKLRLLNTEKRPVYVGECKISWNPYWEEYQTEAMWADGYPGESFKDFGDAVCFCKGWQHKHY